MRQRDRCRRRLGRAPERNSVAVNAEQPSLPSRPGSRPALRPHQPVSKLGILVSILIQAADVSYAHGGNQIFSDISFELKEGDRAALIGENGSGKSCLLYTSPSPRDS